MRDPPPLPELETLVRGLSPGGTSPEAARLLLCLQARLMERAVPEALAGLGPGPLHDARVAGRRLRVGVLLFLPLYPSVSAPVAAAARRVTRGLREARDMDVRSGHLRSLLQRRQRRRDERMLLERLLACAEAGRRAARRSAALAGLGRLALEGLLRGLWNPRRPMAAEAERHATGLLAALSVESSARIGTASVEGLSGVQHRLRISCKELRYSLEMVRWRMGEGVMPRLRTLRRAQDVLGELHDLDLLLAYLAGHGRRAGRADRPACGRLIGEVGEKRRAVFLTFLGMRDRLEGACAPLEGMRNF